MAFHPAPWNCDVFTCDIRTVVPCAYGINTEPSFGVCVVLTRDARLLWPSGSGEAGAVVVVLIGIQHFHFLVCLARHGLDHCLPGVWSTAECVK